MKLETICKYLGLLSGGIALLLMILGVIRYFSPQFFGVRYYWTFIWFANTFLYFGIFCIVVHIACKKK